MKENFRLLDVDSIVARVNTFSLNVQDYEMVTPTLARVLVTYSGTAPTKEEIRAELAKVMGNRATAVRNSFRSLERTGGSKTLAGFVRSQADVKVYDETAAENQGKYMQTASNLLMDNEDKSMWEVKSGSTGKYLVRHGEEDLAELVHLATVRKSGMPVLAQIATVGAEPREIAAWVCKSQEEVLHGYVVAKATDGSGKMTVLAFDGAGEAEDIDPDQLVEVVNMEGEDDKAMGRSMSTAGMDRNAIIEYYKKAYPYAPDYVQEIIDMIDQHATA